MDKPKTTYLPTYLDSPTHYQYESGQKECPSAIPFYEAHGIKCLESDGQFLTKVILPEGWTKEDDGGGYWTYVKDAHGKPRFCYFLKICPWDQDAFTRKTTRYSTRRDYGKAGFDPEADAVVQYKIYDGRETIYECEPVVVKNESVAFDYATEEARLKRIEWHEKTEEVEKQQRAECEAYLDEHFPDWRDTLAYWEN